MACSCEVTEDLDLIMLHTNEGKEGHVVDVDKNETRESIRAGKSEELDCTSTNKTSKMPINVLTDDKAEEQLEDDENYREAEVDEEQSDVKNGVEVESEEPAVEQGDDENDAHLESEMKNWQMSKMA